ncbi:MAG: DNA polymerase III subunit alpha, partial [Muribaculaceae bacterium]|nr:DNA polymerase III subunit alpha [Muribaculaceae bacterium]
PNVLEKIWSEWEKFASYAFNKSHATCYSWVAYQTGYLKANYPAEFMAAVLSRNLDDINKMSFYMDECKAMGLEVKGPDINESFSTFSVSDQTVIRFGLSAIKGIGPDVVRTIIETRENGGAFTDIYDFVERVPSGTLNRRVFDNLVLAGAFDCFGIKREDLSAEAGKKGETITEQLLRYGAQHQTEEKMAATSLFGFDDEEIKEQSRPKIPSALPWDPLTRLNKERELVGMYLSAHPLDSYWVDVRYGVTCTTVEKNEITEATGTPIAFAGMVMGVESRTMQSGSTMTIIKVEDFDGTTDFALFDKQMAEYGSICTPGKAIYVIGTFKSSRNRMTGATNVRFGVDRILPLDSLHGKLITDMTINISTAELKDLEGILDEEISRNHGDDTVPLNLSIMSPELGRRLTFSTGVAISPSRELFKTLDDMKLEFTVGRQQMN